MIYCPACDLATEITNTGTCAHCGGAVVDLTSIIQDAERRGSQEMAAIIQKWAQKQLDSCNEEILDARKQHDVSMADRWSGSSIVLLILMEYLQTLDNGEAQP